MVFVYFVAVRVVLSGTLYQFTGTNQCQTAQFLLRRTFLLAPNAATIALDNLMTGQNELRAVRPEALLVINGKEYPVGGLTGQPVNNFLTEEFINNMQACDSAFMLVDYQISESKERLGDGRCIGSKQECTAKEAVR